MIKGYVNRDEPSSQYCNQACQPTPYPADKPLFLDTNINTLCDDDVIKKQKFLICNNSNKYNDDIYNRNVPEKTIKVNKPYRGKYKLCNKYKDLNDVDKVDIKKKKNIYIAKGPIEFYFCNINTESKLLNINNKASKCIKQLKLKYNNIPNPEDLYSSLTSIDYNKLVKNPDRIKKSSCVNYNINTFNRIDNYNHKNKLKFNYKKMKYQSKLNNLPKTDKYLDNKTLFLIKDSHHDTVDYPILQLGPERTNHKIENIWNNVSRRKHM